jgi:hypothetical protein
MKSKQVKKYLGKVVTYRTVWNELVTAKLIEVDRYFATFEKGDEEKIYIKTFNIAQIQERNDVNETIKHYSKNGKVE